MLYLLLTAALLAQDPEKPPAPAPEPPAPAPGQAAAPAPAKPVEAWDDKTAKDALDEWTKLQKGTPSLAERNRALELFAGGSNKLLVKPLAQTIETDKSLVVRRRAAELLANQPAKDANATIRKLLKSAAVGSQPTLMADLIRALGRCAYSPEQWVELDPLFEREYAVERVPMQEALLDLVIASKEK